MSLSGEYEIIPIPNQENNYLPDQYLNVKRDQTDPLPPVPAHMEDQYMRMDSIVTTDHPNEHPPPNPRAVYSPTQGAGYPQHRERSYYPSQNSYNHDPYGRRPDEYSTRFPPNVSQDHRGMYPRNDSPYISQPNTPVYSQPRKPPRVPNQGYGNYAHDGPSNRGGYNYSLRNGPPTQYPTTYQDQYPRHQYSAPSRGDNHQNFARPGPDPHRDLPSGFEITRTQVEYDYSASTPSNYCPPATRHENDVTQQYQPRLLQNTLPPPRVNAPIYQDSNHRSVEKRFSQANYGMHDPPNGIEQVSINSSINLPPPRMHIHQQPRPFQQRPNNDVRMTRYNPPHMKNETQYRPQFQQSYLPSYPNNTPNPNYHPPLPRNDPYGNSHYPRNLPHYREEVTEEYVPRPCVDKSRGFQYSEPHQEERNVADMPKPLLFQESNKPPPKDYEDVVEDFTHITIVQAPPQPPRPPPQPPRPPTPPSPGWICPLCTYKNKPPRPGCCMCTAPRPDEYRVPVEYELDEEELTKQKEAELNELQEQERQLQLREDNYQKLMEAADQDLLEVDHEFECSICIMDVDVGDGVMLRECLHSFCKECLLGHITHAEDAEVKCPFQGETYQCQSVITEREIKQLLSPEAYQHWHQMGLNQAEGTIQNAFHCKTADCPSWCVYEDNNNFFDCNVCGVQNCLTCKAIHVGKNCKEYQAEIKLNAQNDENAKRTQQMLEDMIKQGEAMNCPKCQVIIQKKLGCDWIRCTVCKTEICWATKGFRWGPKGRGDTTGGCKCRADGRTPCCPECKNCH